MSKMKPAKEPKPKKVKKPREVSRRTAAKDNVKGFFKELKRVRWPSGSVAWKTFWVTLIFIAIAAIVLFLITLGFTTLWDKWGVGL
ncbi:preprotein translocase subunit SecE [Mycoplasma todarodis]|uniref:Preprotein translocase subunit SecE n=1 Tax=Mycoplasma todarodis TaxID=1937191 RepID=A0A4R0XIW4_9MOLU|nr:preprotein translocase subunit SecE [Mycoplasma todarodis]TCG10533.1 preprotein translocase subunit SecE [Mycoplasma todarodis]